MNQALVVDEQLNKTEQYEVRDTPIAMGDHIFYTDIHWYKFFIRNCHNSKECAVQQTQLSFEVVPSFLYKLYFTLLGNWGMWYKVIASPLWNMGTRLLFLIFFVSEALMFIHSEQGEQKTISIYWKYTTATERIVNVSFAGIYFLLSIPCLILRHKAIREVKKNDSKLSYDDQISRMIWVNRCDAATLAKAARKDVGKFTNYKPVYIEICDEAHFSLTSGFSFLNWQFYLMPFYQAGIIGFWLYCYLQYGWDTKELPTK